MKIRQEGAELFHSDGRTDTRRYSIFPYLRTRLKNDIGAVSAHVTCIRSFVKIGRLVQKLK
jgi:hypothetical protein